MVSLKDLTKDEFFNRVYAELENVPDFVDEEALRKECDKIFTDGELNNLPIARAVRFARNICYRKISQLREQNEVATADERKVLFLGQMDFRRGGQQVFFKTLGSEAIEKGIVWGSTVKPKDTVPSFGKIGTIKGVWKSGQNPRGLWQSYNILELVDVQDMTRQLSNIVGEIDQAAFHMDELGEYDFPEKYNPVIVLGKIRRVTASPIIAQDEAGEWKHKKDYKYLHTAADGTPQYIFCVILFDEETNNEVKAYFQPQQLAKSFMDLGEMQRYLAKASSYREDSQTATPTNFLSSVLEDYAVYVGGSVRRIATYKSRMDEEITSYEINGCFLIASPTQQDSVTDDAAKADEEWGESQQDEEPEEPEEPEEQDDEQEKDAFIEDAKKFAPKIIQYLKDTKHGAAVREDIVDALGNEDLVEEAILLLEGAKEIELDEEGFIALAGATIETKDKNKDKKPTKKRNKKSSKSDKPSDEMIIKEIDQAILDAGEFSMITAGNDKDEAGIKETIKNLIDQQMVPKEAEEEAIRARLVKYLREKGEQQ